MWVQSLGWEDSMEEGMATPSRILAWRIPWTEEPGGPQATKSQSRRRLKRLGMLRFLCLLRNGGNGKPLQYSCLKNPMHSTQK